MNRAAAAGRAASALILLLASAGSPASAAGSLPGLPYVEGGRADQVLDLHLPTLSAPAPLVVYVHGGAWRSGSRSSYPTFLVAQGFAVASLDFRSTEAAPFPANVHDIKAALRFLRANAARLGYRGDRIAIAGASSGGHLAALVGVSHGVPGLDGTPGGQTDTTPQVQAIVSWFGASNLQTILAQSTPQGLAVREPALKLLLGDLPGAVPDLARLASPVTHVDPQDPPLLLLHGDQDAQMPINQLHELQGAYERAGAPVQTHVLHGVGHDGGPFFNGPAAEVVVRFLRQALLPR